MVIASFSLATADRKKDGANWVDSTEWHNLVCFGRTAEIVRDYVNKPVRIEVGTTSKPNERVELRAFMVMQDQKLSLLDKMDVHLDRLGDSTGRLTDI